MHAEAELHVCVCEREREAKWLSNRVTTWGCMWIRSTVCIQLSNSVFIFLFVHVIAHSTDVYGAHCEREGMCVNVCDHQAHGQTHGRAGSILSEHS